MWFNGYETKDGKFEIVIVRYDNIVTVSSRNEKWYIVREYFELY